MDVDEALSAAGLPAILPGAFQREFRQAIEDLLDDLKKDSHHDQWTGVDLQRALDPALVVAMPRGQRITQLLAMLPTLLVFAPIAWTWYCLWMAADAYNAYLAQYPETTTTFFTLWQQGFYGYLNPAYAFGEYAHFAILFIAVVVLSYFVGMLVQRREAGAHDKAMRVWQAQLLVIERKFSVIRIENPKRLEESLTAASSVLRDLFSEGRALIEAVRVDIGTIEASSAEVKKASIELADVIKTIHEAQRAQYESLRGLEQSIGAIQESVKAVPAALETGLDANLRQLSDAVRSILDGFAARFETTIQPVNTAMGETGKFLDAYSSRNDKLVTDLAKHLEGYRKMQTAIEFAVMQAQRQAGDSAVKFLSDVPLDVVPPVEPSTLDEAETQ